MENFLNAACHLDEFNKWYTLPILVSQNPLGQEETNWKEAESWNYSSPNLPSFQEV